MAEDVTDKLKRNQQRYDQSELGKASIKKYNDSGAGKASRDRYLKSEKGQAALLRYFLSEKAETSRQKRKAMVHLFRLTDKYLQEHPGALIEEALEEITKPKEVKK